MDKGKNWTKSIVLSGCIVVGFLILFEILGAEQEQMGIVVATILTFTMILCTFSIIDEIIKLKDNQK